MIINNIVGIIILSIVVEKVINFLKGFKKSKFSSNTIRILSLILGILLSYATNLGLLTSLNLIKTPTLFSYILDMVVTGMIIAQGSHLTHDLFTFIYKSSKDFKN
ncbi:MAG: hypothetical protein AB1765_00935 [Candidatus Hydrogenedentota bacterium]